MSPPPHLDDSFAVLTTGTDFGILNTKSFRVPAAPNRADLEKKNMTAASVFSFFALLVLPCHVLEGLMSHDRRSCTG